MHGIWFRLVSMLIIPCSVATAVAQQPEGEERQENALPTWVTDSVRVPLERDRAIRKLFYLLKDDFRRQPDNVAWKIVIATNGAGLPEMSRDKLNETYASLMEWRIELLTTQEIRGKIRIELAKRDAHNEQLEKRLAKIAQELAELKSDAVGRNVADRVADALDATGYVIVDGRVLTKAEANPPFGLTR